MKKYFLIIAFCIPAFFVTVPKAFAWGAEGHRITGLMAEAMLTPKARIMVNQLLDGGSMADAAIFMDVYREALKIEVPGSERWHYNNNPVCGDAQSFNACADGNCAAVQIPRQFVILADKTRTKEDRQQALRFLIHMVGDIHQPLHAADDGDLGGNRKLVVMPDADVPRNLHAVWDSDIVKIATRGLSEANVAKDLLANYKKNFSDWMRGDVEAWMADSFGTAKRLVYGKLPAFSCGTIDGKPAGLYDGKPWPETPYTLPQDYVTGAAGVMPVLLARAGARIGGMLNSALDPEGAIAASVSPTTKAAAAAPVTSGPPAAPKTSSLREALNRPAAPAGK